jgi:hypothetical protein
VKYSQDCALEVFSARINNSPQTGSDMAPDQIGRIELLWRGDRDVRAKATTRNNRLSPMFEALASVNIAAEPAVYSMTLPLMLSSE